MSGRSPVGCISVSLLSEACIAYSKDKFYMGKGYLVHFVNAHCKMNSEVNKSLIEKNYCKMNSEVNKSLIEKTTAK